VNLPQPEAPRRTGLRERKKAKTRAAIQHEALRLFRQQGYGSTTVEEVADAAEVSVSTLFRYFPSKEDLVLSDEYDPLLLEACRAQPLAIGPVETVRRAMRQVFANLSLEELSDMRERAELSVSVPELRAAWLDQLAQALGWLTELVAERSVQRPGIFTASAMAGAMLGVMISAEFYWFEHKGTDLPQLLDDALATLQAGFVR
jgi:AcrR family transcriptional regulator